MEKLVVVLPGEEDHGGLVVVALVGEGGDMGPEVVALADLALVAAAERKDSVVVEEEGACGESCFS